MHFQPPTSGQLLPLDRLFGCLGDHLRAVSTPLEIFFYTRKSILSMPSVARFDRRKLKKYAID